MYLLWLKQGATLTHVISHLAKIAFGIAFMFLLIFAVNKLAVRTSKSGKTTRRHGGS